LIPVFIKEINIATALSGSHKRSAPPELVEGLGMAEFYDDK